MKNWLIKLFLIVFSLIVVLVLSNFFKNKKPDYHLASPFNKKNYLNQTIKTNEKFPGRLIIIPHHLLAKNLINQTLSVIKGNFSTIVLLGPNHENKGNFNIQTTDYDWLTDFGEIKASQKLIKNLTNKKIAYLENHLFYTEHSISNLVSFLKIYFPQSKIVPIILKYKTSDKETSELTEFLADSCRNCLIIASVDFTHKGNLETVKLNDQKSREIIQNTDWQNTHQIICDSPQTIKIILLLAKKQTLKPKQIIEDNSFHISKENPEDITSYLGVIF